MKSGVKSGDDHPANNVGLYVTPPFEMEHARGTPVVQLQPDSEMKR